MTKDYRVQIRVKNNRILSRIEDAGYPSVKSFCRAFGLSYQMMSRLCLMKKSAVSSKTRGWTTTVLNLADALKCNPEDLFNERQTTAAFASTGGQIETDGMVTDSLENVKNIPSLLPSPEDNMVNSDLVSKLLAKMSPRESYVVQERYGLGGDSAKTLDEVAKLMEITRERVRQIEQRAFRTVRVATYKDSL